MNELDPRVSAASAVLVAGLALRTRVFGARRLLEAPVSSSAASAAVRRDHRNAPSARRVRTPAAVWVTAAVLVGLAIDVLLTLLGLAIAVAWRPFVRLRRRRRELTEIERAIPDAIEQLVLVVHAGLTPHQAVRSLVATAPSPTRVAFDDVVHRLDRGDALADALGALPARLGPSMATVADTLAIAERHGTPIGEALVQLSADVRLRRRRLAEADARKLPVRLSFPLVCCTLPSFVLVAIAPAVMAALSSLGDRAW